MDKTFKILRPRVTKIMVETIIKMYPHYKNLAIAKEIGVNEYEYGHIINCLRQNGVKLYKDSNTILKQVLRIIKENPHLKEIDRNNKKIDISIKVF